MRAFSTLVLSFLLSSAAVADEAQFRVARDHFDTALKSDYGEAFDIFPITQGLPDNAYDDLKTGAFYAFRSESQGTDLVVNGFADASGLVVTPRRKAAISDLIQSIPDADIDALVARMMWLFGPMPGAVVIDWHPTIAQVRPALKHRSGGGALHLSWFMTTPENTGLIQVWKLAVDVAAGGKTTFRRERIFR